MKRIPAILVAVSILLTVVPGLTQAKQISPPDQTEYAPAEEHLLDQWIVGLSAANELYRNMSWALDYIDAWTANVSWADLVCARMACILVSGYLAEYEYPYWSLDDDQMLELIEAGVITEVIGEFYAPDEDRLMMYPYFRNHLFPRLDTEAIWPYELESVREISAAMRAYLQSECEILRYATNYLFLPLYDQDKGEALMASLKEDYPVIFPSDATWIADATHLEDINETYSDDILPDIIDELGASMLRAGSRSENALYDFQDNSSTEALSIQGHPDFLPIPFWYDPELADFAFFHFNEDMSPTRLVCGDSLSSEDCNFYFQQSDVTLEQIEAYMESVSSYAKGVTRKGNFFIVLMDDYSVSVSWENQVIRVLFLGEGSTLMYHL